MLRVNHAIATRITNAITAHDISSQLSTRNHAQFGMNALMKLIEVSEVGFAGTKCGLHNWSGEQLTPCARRLRHLQRDSAPAYGAIEPALEEHTQLRTGVTKPAIKPLANSKEIVD